MRKCNVCTLSKCVFHTAVTLLCSQSVLCVLYVLQSGIEADSDDDDFDASLPSCLRECPRITGADVHRNSYNNECTIVLEGT